jgi:5-methyltetrahydropteroyltriglutamate--homocysteine methyltransferase
MVLATNLGFPRLGARRELKWAVEKYWSGRSSEAEVQKTASELRARHWRLQSDLGLDHVPCNDFSLYDHVLDTSMMVNAVPARFRQNGGLSGLPLYFAMARGFQNSNAGLDVPAMEMTKWFDTNYHYIVPEFEQAQNFRLAATKPVDEFREARSLGVSTRSVLLGPISFLLLGKMASGGPGEQLKLLERLLPVYEEVLLLLKKAGADSVQVDEPCLVLDLPEEARAALHTAYQRLNAIGLPLFVATYFGGLRDNLRTALSLSVASLHLDLVRQPEELGAVFEQLPAGMSLSLGVVDGRNIWRTNLDRALTMIGRALDRLGQDRVMVSPSCSLLHVPVDLDLEHEINPELKSWLAFAKQKVEEIKALALAASGSLTKVEDIFAQSRAAVESRKSSPRIHNPAVEQRLRSIDASMMRRSSPYRERREHQAVALKLPLFPTTTIGSFPQTKEVRSARSEWKQQKRDTAAYEAFLREEIARTVRVQEELGLDVLVHGEFERNDMVEYFGEQLAGFAFTQNGWVQSYGSRAVKPPIIFGDVWRPKPMTVSWSSYAQSLTTRPMKGMLTGPVTMLQWSFVRDDQPRALTCRQIALSIRDEVQDLENAGIRVIQIDEPAIREGLPLRRKDWDEYFNWAVEAFRLASSGVQDKTQIHTHMCYSEFQNMLNSIAAMDADVLSIEASRSRMELLDAFVSFEYPNAVGPGVYDIHSPRVPKVEEIENLLRRASDVLDPAQIWVNPDCGLKTRGWNEVLPALTAMVVATSLMRRDSQKRRVPREETEGKPRD